MQLIKKIDNRKHRRIFITLPEARNTRLKHEITPKLTCHCYAEGHVAWSYRVGLQTTETGTMQTYV